jgi:predicted secreted hydrolase
MSNSNRFSFFVFRFAWVLLFLVGCGGDPISDTKPLQLGSLLGNEQAAGYARVTGPEPMEFPRDHGPHPDHRSEWWYWTGNLRTAEGRDFGFQFTVFRFALAPHDTARPSTWGTRQTWLAHLTLSDIAAGSFQAHERSARGALGLAGATSSRVWCDGWDMSDGRLQAAAGDFALDLHLAPGKPIVLQGEQGYSRKGSDPANASLYYSQTRMPTSGTIRRGSETFTVTGTSWMDREWSTSALEPGVVGWDWFALQLADGRDVMFYRLRTADGGSTPFSGGTLIEKDGTSARLAPSEVQMETTATWKSPHGTTYPAAWRLRTRDLDLQITPRLPHQELDLSVRYWEGAVAITGSHAGVGYVELAGY